TAARSRTIVCSDVTLRVIAQESLFVTGPNGSGKTTLLRILAGLTAPAAGVVRFRGDVVATFDSRLRDHVVFSGHLPALKDELSASENLMALVALAGTRVTADQIVAALERVQPRWRSPDRPDGHLARSSTIVSSRRGRAGARVGDRARSQDFVTIEGGTRYAAPVLRDRGHAVSARDHTGAKPSGHDRSRRA